MPKIVEAPQVGRVYEGANLRSEQDTQICEVSRGGELLKLLSPLRVGLNGRRQLLVAVEGALSHGAFQPRAQVLAEDRVLVVEDQPVRAVRQGLS